MPESSGPSCVYNTYPTKQSPAAIAYTAKPFLGCGIVTMVFWQLGHWTRQGDSLRYWLKIGIALGCVTKACFGGWGGLNPSELKKKLISLVVLKKNLKRIYVFLTLHFSSKVGWLSIFNWQLAVSCWKVINFGGSHGFVVIKYIYNDNWQ